MSSPFATFRKNRQFWMAALVLVAILSFVVAPAIETASRAFRGGGPNNTVFVSWDGGRLTTTEVEIAMQKRNQLVNFLRELAKKVIEYGGEPAVPGFSRAPSGEILSLGIDETVNAERICISKILLTQAARMGIEFDDKAADEFLLNFCNQKISDKEFFELLRAHTAGLTMYDIREQLKQELAFLVADNLAGAGIMTRPPAKTWTDFLKLNQTAKVEAYPVYVHEFVGKVEGMPSESEIQEMYEAGKQQLSSPYSETPGFLRPPLANVEFIESRFQDWIDREKANITEEEIRAEYDRLVELGMLRVPETTDEPNAEQPSEADQTTDPEQNPDNSEATESDTPTTEDASTGNDPNSTENNSPESDEPTLAEPDGDAATESSNSENLETDGSTEEEPAESPDGQASLNGRLSSSARMVSYVQEEAQTEGEEQDNDPPTDSDQPSETDQSPVTDQSPETQQPDDSNEIAPTETGEPASQEPPMRTKTFEEAREEVLTDLARLKARPIATDILTRCQQMMREYYLAYRQYNAFKNAGVEDAEAPIRPDLKKYAEENGLVYGETGMIDSSRFTAINLGQSMVYMDGRQVGYVSDVVTAPQIELFFPLISGFSGAQPSDFSEFYFWKVDSRPASVPQLSEVRQDVINAWKSKQARSLAEGAAKELSAKLGAGEDPWSEALNETLRPLVITTDSFPWLSRMGMGMQISITFVSQLDRVGEEFMRQVFDTEQGKVGVAPNQAKSVYYVFRVIEKLPSLEDLRKRFEEDQFKQGPMAIAQMEQAAAGDRWLGRVLEDLNVKFEN